MPRLTLNWHSIDILLNNQLSFFFFFSTIAYNTNITYTTKTYNTNITYNTYITYNTNITYATTDNQLSQLISDWCIWDGRQSANYQPTVDHMSKECQLRCWSSAHRRSIASIVQHSNVDAFSTHGPTNQVGTS